jgi:hypothetical protein
MNKMRKYIFKHIIFLAVLSNGFCTSDNFKYNHDKVGIRIEKKEDKFCRLFNLQNKKEENSISVITINNNSENDIFIFGKRKIIYVENYFILLKNNEIYSKNVCIIGREKLEKYYIKSGTQETFYIPFYTKLIGYNNDIIDGVKFLEQNIVLNYHYKKPKSKAIISKKYTISNKYKNKTLVNFKVN